MVSSELKTTFISRSSIQFQYPVSSHHHHSLLNMVLFPNCKINLGLTIIRKRADGYHDLETVFYPVGLRDAVEVIKSSDVNRESSVEFSLSGLPVLGEAADNLCVKAYHLLKKDFPELPSVQIHLHKTIPMGAGLGGGSADGTFTLKLLNHICQLNLSDHQLIGYALQLGSDCPFFITNKPCFATGRGGIMREITLDLSKYTFLIVNPGIHISTTHAFSQIAPGKSQQSIQEIIQQPVHLWKDQLLNDFEIGVSKLHPEIAQIKEQLYAKGAVYASMTGSGSAVYGLFEQENQTKFSFDPPYLVYKI